MYSNYSLVGFHHIYILFGYTFQIRQSAIVNPKGCTRFTLLRLGCIKPGQYENVRMLLTAQSTHIGLIFDSYLALFDSYLTLI